MGNRIILTAFEPFGGRKKNVSSEVLKNIQKTYDLESLILPVTFKDFKQEMEDMKCLAPDYILSLGESSLQNPELENKAKNLIQYGGKLDNKGKEFYLSTLPNSKIIGHEKNKGYEIKLSNDAGLYVCNFVFYKLSHEFNNSKTKVGFLHLPRDGNVDQLTDLTYLVTDFLEKEQS